MGLILLALDGLFIHFIKNEILEEMKNGRIEKIYQPSKQDIILSFRLPKKNKKLLLSVDANNPRLHFTNMQLENPPSPPMFCMLLRKHIGTGKLINVRQHGLDRILFLDFECVNELGDLNTITLAIEIMGRHSNVILIAENGKIIDSIKRISNEISSVRMVLPGISYNPPPSQNKINIITSDINSSFNILMQSTTEDLNKALLLNFEGLSPLTSREIIFKATKGLDIKKSKLSEFYKNRIVSELEFLKNILISNTKNLQSFSDDNIGLQDFSFMNIEQYGSIAKIDKYDSCSELMDDFFSKKDQSTRMKQRSHHLLKLLINISDRITKKLSLQKSELLNYKNRDILRVYGDLIQSNLYNIKKDDSDLIVQNFYSETMELITIPLDKKLTPNQNAQKYYNEYKKAGVAENILTKLMKQSELEIIYLDSVYDSLTRTNSESELIEIREELCEQGYIKVAKNKKQYLKSKPPIKYKSSDGFLILCGRNNKQNDILTLKYAKKSDMWLHTQSIAGSHIIISSDGSDISNTAIEEAAIIAAFHSKARNSAQVAVDYTNVKNVKKPNGAKPGMVIFSEHKTVYVTPDENIVSSLLIE